MIRGGKRARPYVAPRELPGAAIYFLSDAAGYTTGQYLAMDGHTTKVEGLTVDIAVHRGEYGQVG